MSIRSLNHVALLVSDVERSRQFYVRVLELEEAQRPATFAFPGAWLRKGSIELHLIGEVETGRAAQVHVGYSRDEYARGYGSHLAFEVDDLDETIRHLRGENVEVAGGPRDRGDGVQQLYICDPDGYMIEFFVFPPSNPIQYLTGINVTVARSVQRTCWIEWRRPHYVRVARLSDQTTLECDALCGR